MKYWALLALGFAMAHAGDFESNMVPRVAGEVATLTPVTHDVLVFYTAAAAAKHGEAQLQAMIKQAVANTNATYVNSGVNITLRLIGSNLSPVSESGGMAATLTAFREHPSVISARNSQYADFAVIVSEDPDWCGYGYLWYSKGNVDAFAAVASGCLGSPTFAHEIGHLQGLDHNIEDTTVKPFYPYGHGYRVCAVGGFRDVMSHSCPLVSVPRLFLFSNPALTYNGYPMGNESADSARALNGNAVAVAAYRAPPHAGRQDALESRLVVRVADSRQGRISPFCENGVCKEPGGSLEKPNNSAETPVFPDSGEPRYIISCGKPRRLGHADTCAW